MRIAEEPTWGYNEASAGWDLGPEGVEETSVDHSKDGALQVPHHQLIDSRATHDEAAVNCHTQTHSLLWELLKQWKFH